MTIKRETSCTSLPSTWLAPSPSTSSTPPAEVGKINFRDTKTRDSGNSEVVKKKRKTVPSPTSSEQEKFYRQFTLSGKVVDAYRFAVCTYISLMK